MRWATVPARHLAKYAGTPVPLWDEIVSSLKERIGTGMLHGLVGIRGCGKTQAAIEVGREACTRWVERGSVGPRPFLYRKTMDLFLDVRGTFGTAGRSEREVLEAYVSVSVLVMDEVQERGGTEFEDRMLTYVLDRRYDAKRDTLLVSNLTRKEFAKSIGSSIASRLTECGSVVEFDGIESFRTAKGSG